MNRIQLALAAARGEVTPDHVQAVLQKSRDARTDADTLVKAATGTKPPSGYVAVPGGSHGGFRKKVGAKWSYWYPDTASADAATAHHAGEAKKARKRASDHESRAMTMRHGSGYSDRDRELTTAKEHEEVARGSKEHSIDRDLADSKKLRVENDGKRKAESDKLPDEAPDGHHYVSERGGVKRAVATVAKHGLYAVHGEPVKDGLARNGKTNSSASYTVTHVPTGMNVGGNTRTKSDAVATAKHWHEHAGDAGKDAKLGEQPDKESLGKMRGAYEKLAQKKSEDWRPINATPEQLGVDIQKSFAAPTDRGAVRPDAFAGIQTSQPRRGGGDVMLKGIGAGFDPRWNGDSGFGG